VRVIVPHDAEEPKTRLSGLLSEPERRDFAGAMLADVLGAVRAGGGQPAVLATGDVDCDARVVVDERPLTPAVNDALGGELPTAVLTSDLGLATGTVVRRFLAADGDVVVAPGRGGGTNALVVRHPSFRVDYHGGSYPDHLRIARDIGASVREFDSYRLSTDVDDRSDLAEVLLLGEGAARDWLVDAGIELAVEGGRVGVERA